jgi:hypothetical protein
MPVSSSRTEGIPSRQRALKSIGLVVVGSVHVLVVWSTEVAMES